MHARWGMNSVFTYHNHSHREVGSQLIVPPSFRGVVAILVNTTTVNELIIRILSGGISLDPEQFLKVVLNFFSPVFVCDDLICNRDW